MSTAPEPDKDPIDVDKLSAPERDAYALTEAAVRLDQSRTDAAALMGALEHNLKLWVAIRTMITKWSEGKPLPAEIQENLIRLSHYVADTTFRHAANMRESTLNSLININLQIAQGLLEGAQGPAKQRLGNEDFDKLGF